MNFAYVLLILAVLNVVKMTPMTAENEDESHELIMTIEEPAQEVKRVAFPIRM